MGPLRKKRPLRSILPVVLLILLTIALAESRSIRAEVASIVQNNILVQGDGTATWTAFYGPGEPDFSANKEAYESLGQNAYAEAWSALLNSVCGWNIKRDTMQVTFPTSDSMQVYFAVTNFANKLEESRFAVELSCLNRAGFAFRGSSADGKSYDFLAQRFCDLAACSGPYSLKITLPSPVSNPSFDETTFQLRFQTTVEIMPGVPLGSIVIFIIIVIGGVAILLIVLLLLSRRGLLASRYWQTSVLRIFSSVMTGLLFFLLSK